MDGNEGDARRSSARWATTRRLTLAGTALLAVALAAAVLTVDVDPVVESVLRADPRVLGVATVVYAASWPLRGRRCDDVLETMGQQGGTGFLTMATFASQTANLVVPARAGDGVRAYLVKRHRAVPYPSGFASLAVERAFDLLALVVLSVGALVVVVATGLALGGARAIDRSGGGAVNRRSVDLGRRFASANFLGWPKECS